MKGRGNGDCETKTRGTSQKTLIPFSNMNMKEKRALKKERKRWRTSKGVTTDPNHRQSDLPEEVLKRVLLQVLLCEVLCRQLRSMQTQICAERKSSP